MHRYFEINEKGHNIRCKLYAQDPKSVSRVVVFCHGFGGHKDNAAAEKFAQRMISKYKRTAMVTFNWPCHGDDVKKKLQLSTCSEYLELVVNHIRRKYETDEHYCYGTSFGGYLTLKYIFQHGNPFRKIALRCPAVNMHEVLTRTIISSGELDALQKGKEIPVGFDRKIPVSPAFLEELKTNDICSWDFLDWAEDILILQGTADEIVPFEAVHTFAENNLIEFLPIEGADHRFRNPPCMESAIKGILEFFAL